MVFGILFHHLVVLLNNKNRRFLPLFTKGPIYCWMGIVVQ